MRPSLEPTSDKIKSKNINNNMADEDDMEEDGYDGLSDVEDEQDDNDEDFAFAVEEEHLILDGVDDDDDDANDENSDEKNNEKIKFDRSLPSSHTYLGEEMDDVSGRTVMEDDNIVTIPLLSFPNLMLVPGQTLPLTPFQPQLVAMMKNILEKDKTFGVVTDYSQQANMEDQSKKLTGTTCEIFSVKEECAAGINTIRVKAMARKRFEVISLRRQVDGTRIGTVRILPDILVPAYPSGALPQCIRPSRMITSPLRAMTRIRQTSRKQAFPSCSAWPAWVYELYNPYLLMSHIKLELRSWSEDLKIDTIPAEPTEFSYWITHNLPLDDKLRNQLLKQDCPIQRLRRQLEIIQKYSIMICQDCERTIADKKDLFCMSLGGPMAAYVNPGGHIHETVTFHKTKGLRLRGNPSTLHSWFPGYAWTMAECRHCGNHMGWKFTAVDKKLIPAKFWGLARASLRPSLRQEEEEK